MNGNLFERNHTLFVGAEGASEAENIPGVRMATEEEIQALRDWFREVRAQGDSANDDFEEFFVDKIGRPYFLLTVTPLAPIAVLEKASGHLRCLRLTD